MLILIGDDCVFSILQNSLIKSTSFHLWVFCVRAITKWLADTEWGLHFS